MGVANREGVGLADGVLHTRYVWHLVGDACMIWLKGAAEYSGCYSTVQYSMVLYSTVP